MSDEMLRAACHAYGDVGPMGPPYLNAMHAALTAALAPLPEPDAWKQRDRDATHWHERFNEAARRAHTAEQKLAKVREWARDNGYRDELTAILDEEP